MNARLPSFWTKVLLAVGLVAAADYLLFQAGDIGGGGLGAFALLWCGALAVTTPAVLRNGLGRIALLLAIVFAALQIERPTLVGWALFGLTLGVAALSPRAARHEDAWRWLQRLLVQGLKGLIGPLLDLHRLGAPRLKPRRPKLRTGLAAAILPLLGGFIFLCLFIQANPLIEAWVRRLAHPRFDVDRLPLWVVVGLASWGILRPRFVRKTRPLPEAGGDLRLPGVTTQSIVWSLIVFNLIFALQNGLDLAFLWRGGALPAGMSHAEYVHRGAYPLMATALLAGLFVLGFLRPGSPTAESKSVRALVVLWIAQNLLLVASTGLRTIAYVQDYSLTVLRLAALIWMGLVALGLCLICWRLILRRSPAWLVNANVLAAGLVLAVCSLIDLGAVAAHWNVRHARELDGYGPPLDVGYLGELGDAGLVELRQLQACPIPDHIRAEIAPVAEARAADLRRRQADWRTWTARGYRRLSRAEMLQQSPSCTVMPLTAPAQPRT